VPAEGNWLVLNWATPTLVNEATVVINSDKTSKDYPCRVFQLPRQAIRAVLTSWLLGAPSEWVWYPPGATVEKFFRHRSWVLPDQSGAAQQGPLPTMIRSAMATAKVAEVLAVLKTNPCHPTDVADYACFPHNSGHQLRTLLMHYFFKNALQLQASQQLQRENAELEQRLPALMAGFRWLDGGIVLRSCGMGKSVLPPCSKTAREL
jgi:hypothetical protein